MAAARAAIERTYTGLCNVMEKQDQKVGNIMKDQEIMVLENVSCRLSFQTLSSSGSADPAAKPQQIIRLFLAPEYEIAPGSKIVVTQTGRTGEYCKSGTAAVYPTHQEIILEVFERWA